MFRSAMTRVRVIIVLFVTSLGTNCIGSSQFYIECHFFAEGYMEYAHIENLVQVLFCQITRTYTGRIPLLNLVQVLYFY